jgi:hypothetical protein
MKNMVLQQLLRSEEGLLMLRVAEETKHELDGAQPMVSLQRLTRFSEGWRMSGQKLSIGGRSLSLCIPCPLPP